MKPILLILLLTVSVSAQAPNLPWRSVVADANIKVFVAEIARGDKEVKFWLRFDFPRGAHDGVFPVNGVGSVRTEATFNCEKRSAKLTKGYGYFYDRLGQFIKKAKDKQKVSTVPDSVGSYIVEYFCEQPSTPSAGPPKLKPKT